jgi:trimethylamine:corrinoid methyltransferase-like protein
MSRIKSITNPRLSLGVLSPEDVRRLHNATLTVIERTGVRFPSPRALEIWAANGARVDWQTQSSQGARGFDRTCATTGPADLYPGSP